MNTSPAVDAPATPPSLAVAGAKLAALALLMAGLGWLAWQYNIPLEDLKTRVGAIDPILRYPAYVALYALVSIAPVPARDVVKVTGAILFGGWMSGWLIFFGEMLATVVCWILGRALGKDMVDRMTGARLSSLREKIRGATWWQIALLRLFPGTPYRFFNYAGGVTDIRPVPYFAGTAAGTLPRTLFFQWLFGVTGGAIAKRGTTTFELFLISIGLAATMLVGFWIYQRRKARTAKSA
ncbi:MAG: TVP38/TMEM64 family protein [Deltaproteobacteria bacterium]|nr:TVP38/TMEM64 family protein [Deltaproteobacteria bacterium]MCB9487752.1 TVP38/TMEM64 family protein [Deltaproteobacteria bacterium]